MKRIIYFLLISLLFTNCAHRIVRTGYQVNKSDYKNCDVIIKKNIEISDTLARKVGEIKLGEFGFSIACSEEHAINILKNEACAIRADLIIITEENRPDLWSSCYRCRADFYQYNYSSLKKDIQNDVIYKPENVHQRVSKDRNKNTAIAIGAVVTGFLLALLMF